MNALFPSITPDREAALILLARERRKTRKNIAAYLNSISAQAGEAPLRQNPGPGILPATTGTTAPERAATPQIT